MGMAHLGASAGKSRFSLSEAENGPFEVEQGWDLQGEVDMMTDMFEIGPGHPPLDILFLLLFMFFVGVVIVAVEFRRWWANNTARQTGVFAYYLHGIASDMPIPSMPRIKTRGAKRQRNSRWSAMWAYGGKHTTPRPRPGTSLRDYVYRPRSR